MRFILVICSVLTLQLSVASAAVTQIKMAHTSPFCSTVERPETGGVMSLPNTHEVLVSNDGGARVLRGSSPFLADHIDELIEQNIGHVIVFKNFYGKKKKRELEDLYRDNGYSRKITFLPVPWQAVKGGRFDEAQACRWTVQAMKIARTSQVPVFFHCTVGEDRTGLLAALIRLSVSNVDIETVFKDEMCGRGYESGNPRKAQEDYVIAAIRANLTPMFLKMAQLMSTGTLEEKACDRLPEVSSEQLRRYECRPETEPSRFCSAQ